MVHAVGIFSCSLFKKYFCSYTQRNCYLMFKWEKNKHLHTCMEPYYRSFRWTDYFGIIDKVLEHQPTTYEVAALNNTFWINVAVQAINERQRTKTRIHSKQINVLNVPFEFTVSLINNRTLRRRYASLIWRHVLRLIDVGIS